MNCKVICFLSPTVNNRFRSLDEVNKPGYLEITLDDNKLYFNS